MNGKVIYAYKRTDLKQIKSEYFKSFWNIQVVCERKQEDGIFFLNIKYELVFSRLLFFRRWLLKLGEFFVFYLV